MASVTIDTFERYRDKGLAARKAGQWESARTFLLEAARAMAMLAREESSERLQEARRATAAKLLELARDCEARKDEPPPRPTRRQKAAGTGAGTGGGGADNDNDDGKDAMSFLVREKPSVRFEDIAGLDDVKEEIRLRMIYPLEHPELAAEFKINVGGGVLLYGPPGTGKTLLARATAGEIDAAFFTVSAADVLSKWVGEAEQNVKKLFDAAVEHSPSVIFIDEIESLVPARRDDGGGGVMQRVVPQILQGMEGFAKKAGGGGVMFMGATNVPWQLDPAVLRPGRFDAKVHIPLPDLPARRKMLDLYLSKRPLDDAVNLDALAQQLDGYSGADIRYLCDRCAIIPFMLAIATKQKTEITLDVVRAAMQEVRPSVHPSQLARFAEWARENS
jgi:transitional endoplasmic reticulum ATPase